MRALVTGATGFIGRHLVRQLRSHGLGVRALVRDPRRAEEVRAAGAEVRAGDLRDAASLDGLLDGVDVVHHLASAVVGPWEDFVAVDIRGTERLLREAARAGVSRFVYGSSLAVYASRPPPAGGEEEGNPLDEDAPLEEPERAGHYGRAKIEAEALVRSAARAGAVETVIIRPGLVYGPGRDPWLGDAPHLGARLGPWLVVLGDGGSPLPLVFVTDVAEAFRLCGETDPAAGGTFNIVDSAAPTRRAYVDALTRLGGSRRRLVALPRWTAYPAGAAAVARARLARRQATTTPARLLAKAASPRFASERARQVLGWTPRVPLEEGLERAIRWWRSEAEHPG